ncbi:MAG: hypothetical protein K8J08_06555 [Thermoanaerobaculia bacterium]|nr:hypothetical protein [Thermoanaerobaculia bacterium]
MITLASLHTTSPQDRGLRRSFGRTLLLGTVFCLAVVPLHGSDGAIEINQVRAEVGGVTLGDTPGFPVTLSEPGSYRLTGNLDVRNTANAVDTTAIHVTSEGVSIDLGGFAIRGPVVCTASGGPPSTLVCSPAGGFGHGIASDSGVSTRVANGTVMGMGYSGVSFAAETRSVVAISNGVYGIISELIVDSQGSRNGYRGLDGSVVSNSIANENGDVGIFGGVVIGSSAVSNSGTGILASAIHQSDATINGGAGLVGDLILGSRASSNTQINAASGYALNDFLGNNGGSGQPQIQGVEIGANLCSGDTSCP